MRDSDAAGRKSASLAPGRSPAPLSSPPAAAEAYNEAVLLFHLIEEEVKDEKKFPVMSAGPSYHFLWQDSSSTEYAKPTKLSARKYMEELLTWAEKQVAAFPSGGEAFPEEFASETVPRIMRRLFRIYAHIYYHHYDSIVAMEAITHLNTCFKHFIFLAKRFTLIPEAEMAPLAELISSFEEDHKAKSKDDAGAGSASASASASS